VLVKKLVSEGLSEAEAEARAHQEMRNNARGDWRDGYNFQRSTVFGVEAVSSRRQPRASVCGIMSPRFDERFHG
jgi:hypothetical protein